MPANEDTRIAAHTEPPDAGSDLTHAHVLQRRIAVDTDLAAIRQIIQRLETRLVGDDAAIIAAELLGNAIRHGRPFEDGTVALRIGWDSDRFRIEVADAGAAATPQMVDEPPSRDGQRGLAMIDRLADRWGYRSASTTTFWAELGSSSSATGASAVLEKCRRLLSSDVSPPLDQLLGAVAVGMSWPLVEYRTAVRAGMVTRAGAGICGPTPGQRDLLDAACDNAMRGDDALTARNDDAAQAMTVIQGGAVLGVLGVVGPASASDRMHEILLWVTGLLAPVLAREANRQTEDYVIDRLTFLARAGAVLSSSLDYDRTLEEVAKLLVPERADWCTINLVNEDGSIRRVAAEHARPDARQLLLELLDRHPHDPDAASGVPLVIRTGEPLLFSEVSDDLLEATANNPEYLEITRGLAIRSCVIVPLAARGQVLGTISVVSTDVARFRYDETDLAILRDLARRAALAIDNARLYTSRTKVAQALQQSLLPEDMPAIPGMDVACRYVPASSESRMGGDFYDIVPAEDGSWYAVIGDVQGKGIEAATLIGLARHTLRAAALQRAAPAEALRMLNTALLASARDRSCTAVCARLVPNDHGWTMTIARAGHTEPIVLDAEQATAMELQGIVLGLFPDPLIRERTMPLSVGQAVVLLTDGAVGAQPEAENELRAKLAAMSRAPATAIAASVVPAHDIDDDLAVLVLQPVSVQPSGGA